MNVMDKRIDDLIKKLNENRKRCDHTIDLFDGLTDHQRLDQAEEKVKKAA